MHTHPHMLRNILIKSLERDLSLPLAKGFTIYARLGATSNQLVGDVYPVRNTIIIVIHTMSYNNRYFLIILNIVCT